MTTEMQNSYEETRDLKCNPCGPRSVCWGACCLLLYIHPWVEFSLTEQKINEFSVREKMINTNWNSLGITSFLFVVVVTEYFMKQFPKLGPNICFLYRINDDILYFCYCQQIPQKAKTNSECILLKVLYVHVKPDVRLSHRAQFKHIL